MVWSKENLIQKLGTPEDFWKATIFLSSKKSSFITSQEITITWGEFEEIILKKCHSLMIISQSITEPEFCKVFLAHFQRLYQKPEITEIKIDYMDKSSVKIENSFIILNREIYENTNPFAALIIFLHDLYHEYKQNIAGYSQVLIMKRLYGDMSLIFTDVDVDLRMFKYFDLTFENYLKIFFEERNTIFADVGGQYKNLVRLISSLLSLYIYSETGKSIIIHLTFEEDFGNMYILSLENMEFNFVKAQNIKIKKLVEDFYELSTTRKNYQNIYPHLKELVKLFQ